MRREARLSRATRYALYMDGNTKRPVCGLTSSLLLGSTCRVLLPLARDDLAKHHHAVAIHEGNPREALAILEGIADERLLRLEAALGHLVRLQRMRLLHFLAACLLAHLPLELGDPAGCPTAAHESDGRIAHLDLVGDVQDLDLRVELARLSQSRVLLETMTSPERGMFCLSKPLMF